MPFLAPRPAETKKGSQGTKKRNRKEEKGRKGDTKTEGNEEKRRSDKRGIGAAKARKRRTERMCTPRLAASAPENTQSARTVASVGC